MSNKTKWQVCAGLALALTASLALAQPHDDHRDIHRGPPPRARVVRPPPPHAGFRWDARYGHAHYYPPRGFAVGVLPVGYVAVRGGYFFAGGVFYAARGPGYVVVAPPYGLFVTGLPPFYATVTLGGVPYYYANDTYYVAAPGGYQVVAPPPGADQGPMDGGAAGDPSQDDQGGQAAYTPPPPGPAPAPAAAPPPPPPAAGGPPPAVGAGLFVYPMNGQNDQQQSQDKWECHQWSVKQTGYDPTAPGGGAAPGHRADYNRAMGACLTGRGYSVK